VRVYNSGFRVSYRPIQHLVIEDESDDARLIAAQYTDLEFRV